ncbi:MULTISPECIES: hypothetical protein [Burkholderia]|uniref:hypothetical protein n=1 Tax=Burkholderia TaxID=32008 RepID=UPI000A43375F|nr:MULTISPECIES: hypothetical protein [Burkholderia]
MDETKRRACAARGDGNDESGESEKTGKTGCGGRREPRGRISGGDSGRCARGAARDARGVESGDGRIARTYSARQGLCRLHLMEIIIGRAAAANLSRVGHLTEEVRMPLCAAA